MISWTARLRSFYTATVSDLGVPQRACQERADIHKQLRVPWAVSFKSVKTSFEIRKVQTSCLSDHPLDPARLTYFGLSIARVEPELGESQGFLGML